jgi:hypothetical protein
MMTCDRTVDDARCEATKTYFFLIETSFLWRGKRAPGLYLVPTLQRKTQKQLTCDIFVCVCVCQKEFGVALEGLGFERTWAKYSCAAEHK